MINQRFLPHHLLTRIMGIFLNSRIKPLKNWQINKFIKVYDVDMSIAVKPNAQEYKCFNEFFARKLTPESRPIGQDLISPSDGLLTEFNEIKNGTLIQAKKFNYSLESFLTDYKTEAFEEGSFATFYLAPEDYHRVHSPVNGTLTEIIHIPGRLFSVNPRTTSTIPNIYSRNERVIFHFDTDDGPVALVMVGAMLVGSIETNWTKLHHPRKISHHKLNESVHTGQDLGCFKFGSTVITLFSNPINVTLDENTPIKMGQKFATYC